MCTLFVFIIYYNYVVTKTSLGKFQELIINIS